MGVWLVEAAAAWVEVVSTAAAGQAVAWESAV